MLRLWRWGPPPPLVFRGKYPNFFFYGPAESLKKGSWGSVVGEGRGCRRLIEAEAGATGAICVECVD
jgi:hypothetical protein